MKSLQDHWLDFAKEAGVGDMDSQCLTDYCQVAMLYGVRYAVHAIETGAALDDLVAEVSRFAQPLSLRIGPSE